MAATIGLGTAGGVRAQALVSGGNATIYVGTYNRTIYVLAESTLSVVDRIPFRSGLPTSLTLSQDRKRLYARDATFEHVEVIDLQTRQSVDTFTLSTGNARVRIWSMDIDPQQRYAVFLIKRYTKLADRFEIGPPRLIRYDLAKHAVMDTIPWPKGEDREFARMLFSPDGKLLYFFSDDILIYETEHLREVDRWQLSQPLEDGMGRFNFGFPVSLYEEPGFYTGLFRITDPVQNRRMMGVARVNLVGKSVDFYALGPDEPVGFALAPDRKRAYGVRQMIGDYQFWTFDLDGHRVASRVPFKGRPRMALASSSNGRLLYIYSAGSTIDVYDAATYQYVRTVTLDADMTGFVIVPTARPATGQ